MIVDNEHDPEQDPEYFSPRERLKLAGFIVAAMTITALWGAFLLGWVLPHLAQLFTYLTRRLI